MIRRVYGIFGVCCGLQSNVKYTSLSNDRLDPNRATLKLYGLCDNSEPDTGARIFILTVQSLKDLEDSSKLRCLDTNSAIAYAQHRVFAVDAPVEHNVRSDIKGAVGHRVAE